MSLDLNLVFLTFLMFGLIWMQSHMQATGHQSEILHSLTDLFKFHCLPNIQFELSAVMFFFLRKCHIRLNELLTGYGTSDKRIVQMESTIDTLLFSQNIYLIHLK